MITVAEIKAEILKLKPEEIRQLDKWVQDFCKKLQKNQNEAGFKAGRAK